MVLDEDIRVDDIEQLVNAIQCMRNVVKVEPNISNVDDYINRTRIQTELMNRIVKAVYSEEGGERINF